MAAVLVVETGAGLADANSYATMAEADAYHDTRLHAESWTAADADIRAAALIWATRLLDDTVAWAGERAFAASALRWPRVGVFDADRRAVPRDTVPARLKAATAELARLLIEADLVATPDVQGLRRVRLGSIEIEPDARDRPPLPPAIVRRMLHPLGRVGAGLASRLVRT